VGAETRAELRVRFAPSPTGFLHVGSARTALFNWLFARRNGGTYLLRIEDTDEERNRQDWTEGIVTALDWLGIPPDEPAVMQSSRGADHQAAIEQLWEGGYLYACDCSREEVLARTKDKAIPGYDGYCRDRGLDRQSHALRFKVPDVGSVVVRDLIRGDVSFPMSAIEDFVVVKSNGGPLFALANVVDDRSMRISHVIRGEDLLPSAPKALLLWQALDGATFGADGESGGSGGLPLPAYAHLPMLVNEKREKISKRRSDVAVEFYSSEGFLPSAFANYLALLGWGHPQGIEIFDIADVAPVFALEEVHHAPAFFDVAKLRHINSEHVRSLQPEAFIDVALPWVMAEAEVLDNPMLVAAMNKSGTPWPKEHFDPAAFRRIAPHVQQRISTLSEVPPMVDFLFLEHPIIDDDDWKAVESDESATAILDLAISAYESCEFEPDELHRVTGEIAESVGRKLAKAQAPIRVAITGKRVGPPLFESMAILGREKVLERLRAARSRLGRSGLGT
jgi:glutamyl-tRNA synthetase